MDAEQMAVAVAPGVSLNVRHREGAGGRRPFLLVHGLASNARLWDEVAEVLAAAGHPTYAVDLRCHGESDCPPDGHDTATAARDVAAVAAALGLTGAVVAGQSWGSNIVVRVAAEHGQFVAALALLDGGWIDLANEFDSWEACAGALRPPDLDGMRAEDMHAWLTTHHPDWSPAAVDATVANLRVSPQGRLSRRLPIPHHMAIVRSMYDDPPHRFYPVLAVPTLLLPAVPDDPDRAARVRARVKAAAAAMRDATIREYVGAGHDLHAQHPGGVADDLLRLAEPR